MDYSDRDRRRVLEVIDLFREEDTRDELGIGVIRDAFADRLFPGTSTIQTRVRYFLFIPWVFQMGDGGVSSFADKIRWRLDLLRKSLVKGEEETGVIGYRAKAAVQRLPSSVYWQGLKKWGILRFDGSETDYYRFVSRQQAADAPMLNDDGEVVGFSAAMLWHPRLPEPPTGWRDATTFALTREEAVFLAERIRQSASQSLLAWLIDQDGEPAENTNFVWEQVAPKQLPEYLVETFLNARHFSEFIHGAALLYNLMLAEEKEWNEKTAHYEHEIAGWWHLLQSQGWDLKAWGPERLWDLMRDWKVAVPRGCSVFVESWLHDIGKCRSAEEVIHAPRFRELIRSREKNIKRGRARLGNRRALDNWSGTSGTAQLDYRWRSPVRALVRDVIRGLRVEV